MTNFEETYYGNRAPFPIYIHTPWFNDDRIADLQKFAGGHVVGWVEEGKRLRCRLPAAAPLA